MQITTSTLSSYKPLPAYMKHEYTTWKYIEGSGSANIKGFQYLGRGGMIQDIGWEYTNSFALSICIGGDGLYGNTTLTSGSSRYYGIGGNGIVYIGMLS